MSEKGYDLISLLMKFNQAVKIFIFCLGFNGLNMINMKKSKYVIGDLNSVHSALKAFIYLLLFYYAFFSFSV